METLNKTCDTCLYAGTHENCSNCLGSIDEQKEREKQGFKGYDIYLYKYWVEGDAAARVLQFQKDGKRNIVIGGMGEAEVNVKWTPEETLESLCNVSEQCGYLTTKGKWLPHLKEIYIITDYKYKLTYYNDTLDSIDRIVTRNTWRA